MESNGALKRDPTGRRVELIRSLEDHDGPESRCLPLASSLSWVTRDLGGIPRGASMLMTGDPGIGKTTLALQVAAAAATLCQRVLYIATEQSAEALGRRLEQVSRCPRARHYLHIKDDTYDLRVLPALLANQILSPGSKFHGTSLVIIDSLQGAAGLSPGDGESWAAILGFMRQASAAGLTVLALAHRTKGGAIAGPRTLEHSCDVVLVMRRGVACRSILTSKNRFGPTTPEPLALRFNPGTTCLEPAPIGHGSTASVRTLSGGAVTSIEAALIPARADRGYLKCPGMRAREVDALADTLQRCWPEARTMWALGVTLRAPAGFLQTRDHGLAIVAVLMAALRRASISGDTIVIGDIGLDGRAAPVSDETWQAAGQAAEAGELSSATRIVASPNHRAVAASFGCELVIVKNIEDLARLVEASNE